jgi:processive 1,2-diacylglycerol beta-glucosyltransferase
VILPMPRVLITTAPYGSGHDRVAASVARAVEAEGAQVEIVDHFARFVSPLFARASQAVFWQVLRHAPRAWGLVFTLSDRLPTQSPVMAGNNRLGARGLERYLAAFQPDAVVHVHPSAAGAMAWLRARGLTRAPQAIVLTDFLAHGQWIYPHVERYFVPAEPVRDQLVARGVSPEHVVVSGMPIDLAFAAPADRGRLRRELGVEGGGPGRAPGDPREAARRRHPAGGAGAGGRLPPAAGSRAHRRQGSPGTRGAALGLRRGPGPREHETATGRRGRR